MTFVFLTKTVFFLNICHITFKYIYKVIDVRDSIIILDLLDSTFTQEDETDLQMILIALFYLINK